MYRFFRLWFGLLARCFRSHRTLLLENLALRQQLTVLKRKHRKPKVGPLDKLFWVLAHRFWSAWKGSLVIVTPETVARWHRAGFRRYWSLISRVKERVGRKKLSQEIRDLIFQMATDNPTWGAPRIRRASPAGLRCIRAKHLPLDQAKAPKSRTGPTLAGLSSQSSRSHRCHGFLHGPHGHLPAAVLLLYY